MRMQLLSNFQIAIVANGVNYAYDYDPKSNLTDHQNTLTSDDRWSQTATADPVSDITDAQDTIEDDTGTKPTRAICTKSTWKYLLNNDNILNDMDAKGYVGNTNANVNDNMLKRYLMEELDLTVAIYNKKYSLSVKNQSAQNFFPDDVFTLIPDQGTLGNTYYGTTPEESDLMSGQSDADVQIVDTGIAVTTKTISTPVNVESIVSGIMLPSFERIEEVYILNVNG